MWSQHILSAFVWGCSFSIRFRCAVFKTLPGFFLSISFLLTIVLSSFIYVIATQKLIMVFKMMFAATPRMIEVSFCNAHTHGGFQFIFPFLRHSQYAILMHGNCSAPPNKSTKIIGILCRNELASETIFWCLPAALTGHRLHLRYLVVFFFFENQWVMAL